MTSSKFDGQVIFDCTRPNLKERIIGDLLRSEIPEAAKFPVGSKAASLFENLAAFLGRTRGIAFHLAEPRNPDLIALSQFWQLASGAEKDYCQIWDQFTLLINLEVHNEWMEALNDTIPDDLVAPPELHPDAPEDAVLEVTDPNDSERATQ